jgi:D-beta-D-heptose 7-phosphate kinase/D-beta-D-heptose 1-phosphate adenosyltransferase
MKKVWVNGTFDVLHVGHIKLLEFAAKYGIVRVGIDSDLRIKQLKGESRPINTLVDRVYFLKSIKFVDSVVGFNTDEGLIQQIKFWEPDYMRIGSDYENKNIIGREFIKEEVIFFNKIPNMSSTNIINKLWKS